MFRSDPVQELNNGLMNIGQRVYSADQSGVARCLLFSGKNARRESSVQTHGFECYIINHPPPPVLFRTKGNGPECNKDHSMHIKRAHMAAPVMRTKGNLYTSKCFSLFESWNHICSGCWEWPKNFILNLIILIKLLIWFLKSNLLLI